MFVEGDQLHPPANVGKMASGIPLDDADRAPWLERVAQTLGAAAMAGGGVAACSALKRRYRDRLRARLSTPPVFIFPTLTRDVLEQRLAARQGHYMPLSLLDSQLAALEPPDPDEDALVIDAGLPVQEQIDRIASALGCPACGPAA